MQKFLFLFVLLANTLLLSAQTTGKVVKVADGDTFTILDSYGKSHRIRLYGIDCPELNQPFGKEAKRYTSNLVLQKMVSIEKISTDRNGRMVAKVTLNSNQSINELLLKNGMAWHFLKYDKSKTYAALAQQARAAKLGLWAYANPIAPWDWRKRKKL